MARISKQIGWSQESNLLYEILRKLGELAGIAAKVKPYKVYSALITDDDPNVEALVLENTIGDIQWAISGPGEYKGTLNGAFPENNTWASITISQTGVADPFYLNVTGGAPDYIKFYTQGTVANKTPIEIRVYN